jgi:hypothetical protein
LATGLVIVGTTRGRPLPIDEPGELAV